MTGLVALPSILPLIAAGLSLVFGRSARAQRIISVTALSLTVVVAIWLLYQAHNYGPQVIHIGGWPAGLGISLVADQLAALLLLISSIVTLFVLLYSFGQGIVVFGRETPLSVFYPTYLVLSAGVSNAFLAGDLFNLFVGFEVLLAASYVLITLGGTEARVRSGTTYVVVALMSSLFFLTAIAVIYAATGTVNMAELSTRIADLPTEVQTMLQLILLTAFGVKAAVFPLSSWLPDSYPTAPANVTAVFAGLLTKVGVYAIIRTQTLLFVETDIHELLMVAAFLTMIFGILGAVAQSDIKRMLSFTLVSHIGFMIFGIALDSPIGLTGSIYYVIHHITIQTTLFLVAGLIEIRSGTTAVDRLGGLAKSAPIMAAMFFIPAINLAGIPPFSGFIGKLALIQGGVELGSVLSYLLVFGSIVTSLLTLYAIAKAWNRAFWQPATADDDSEDSDTLGALYSNRAQQYDQDVIAGELVRNDDDILKMPRGMALPTLALIVVGLALMVFAGPLIHLANEAALELLDPSIYVQAMFEVVN